MKDYLHSLLKFVDRERGKVFGILLAIGLAIMLVGCPAVVDSPFDGTSVDRTGLQTQILRSQFTLEEQKVAIDQAIVAYNAAATKHNAQVETAEEALLLAEQHQRQLIETLSGAVIGILSGDPIQPAQIAMNILTALGLGGTIGGIYDAHRKNKLIETLQRA